MKTLKIFLLAGPLLLPVTGFAACGGERTFGWVVCILNERVITPLIGVVIALAMLFFFWGLGKYLSGDAKKIAEAKDVMWFSVLAMFVIFSIWGIVRVLMATVGISENEKAPIPKIYP